MLEITDLNKKYDDRVIFKDLNLRVQPGEIMTIVGPSGIGKTTFLRILAGLLPADSGRMTLSGDDVDVTGNRMGAQVGVIFQDFNLFPQYSVKENIGLALKLVAKLPQNEVDEQVKALMEQLDLTAYQNQYPHALSGGQKQRVAIARALAMQPGVLAYDEPTSGLDEASTARVVEVIKGLQLQGVTQLIVTHDLAFADQLDATVFDFSTDVQR
ncbi:amino acid ABC transporter ATP-binding protein [Weissella tructae]|uniref:ABC-type polar amino acid transport system,ATPase component n=2 Tax=Weissella TaxID=46255 RepID=A0A075TZ92_9LACO|nr:MULTISPECIES: ATP-binding cassette domain-containing protein [Weissella]AIG65223.1 ABC-type polar amino acid transport system,ATPase component [Weissella tructae]AIM62536.1 ABC-type polar amino acid transport system,ATPase component [Weissella ceti]AIM63872.1 ABC-type polar amino acid transport system,ATPase component [Weissella ceti]ELA07623.1 arginine transport ATP-binding protein artM [Weissella ceti NC36]QVV91949.1 ATP-binding cassette domain-containing protein [Weissella tructae]